VTRACHGRRKRPDPLGRHAPARQVGGRRASRLSLSHSQSTTVSCRKADFASLFKFGYACQRWRPKATDEEEREPNRITGAAPTAPAAGGACIPIRQGSLELPRRGRARGVGARPVFARRRCLQSRAGVRSAMRRPGRKGPMGAVRRGGPRHLSRVADGGLPLWPTRQYIRAGYTGGGSVSNPEETLWPRR
jgi:hypothetical protein